MSTDARTGLDLTEPIERLLADSKYGTQLQVRIALLEQDALWAIHAETKESQASLIRQAIQEFLLKRGKLTKEQVAELRTVHRPRRSSRVSIV